jgi:SAM-dependent methyltransferase
MQPKAPRAGISIEKAIKNAFDVIGSSNEYPSSFYPRSAGRMWPVLRDLTKVSPGKLLDIGCGVGFMSSIMSQLGFEVHCIDASQDIDGEVIRKFNLHFSLCNIESSPIPYSDNSFDIVVLTEVLEHFNYNPLVPLEEIKRILKPEGLLFLTTPNIASIFSLYTIMMGDNVQGSLNMILGNVWRNDYGKHQVFRDMHFRCYTNKEVKQLMKMLGLSIVRHRSIVRGEPSTRNLPRKLFLYLAKSIVALTNSRLWGDTIYVIAKKAKSGEGVQI